MSEENLEDDSRYEVVVNHEEQYSIWPEGREIPLGWNTTGKAGSKAECLAYIEQVSRLIANLVARCAQASRN